ncbi:hypothetical protein DPMN_181127 [Dreissena polymorpha]|uniref:Uncharacterized protein n=1 Tax=Dreissena polymorpha TaxID=45954 RepID=A0A9D4DDV1_DREPO|nr:hypothetical protein DPMN_181127 [Dreissena polymorpha]
MDTQFSDLQTKAAMGLKFIPEQMCSSPVSACDLEWFNDDLPSPQSLPAELTPLPHPPLFSSPSEHFLRTPLPSDLILVNRRN